MGSSSTNPSSETLLKVGIVGFGPFGQFLSRTILKQGHLVTATSQSDHSQLCSELGITFYREMDQFCNANNDVILLCPSILSLSSVLESLRSNRLEKGTLFVDVLSVKEHPRDLLLNVLPEECDVLCTHPMFGPESGKDGWSGLPLVFDKVRIRNESLCMNFLSIFEKEGCRMVEMSCTEHDKLAARSQFLTHTIGRILSEMKIESTLMDTKGFQTLLQLRDNTMKDSLDLYCGLFKHNKFAKQELENLEGAFHSLKLKLQETEDAK
ncbi:arogenate dehydrogenase 1, chloroplastic isoform X1 [Cinnamomum micranthum f. kanehirae]|uniref:Arogenate dehydrogenase 1, chloroplastic isoform X1 n=1 Tax=Cinnamomum micranthum f. kanehirae TaxID=337451 RepID=A0A3S4NLZ7_9MAGN|nr:arogenate dehydrogenase 1, chloroplastic isoform X1 [Cinnamomum micranthum f. kanehirae]